ncbi:hypothetical protein ACGFIY_33455 [Micromonospora chersina]|uniref:hypothetical protein n=1 Tax=Micromonospora chersina TaxID=47854 RepID=UPI003722888A
MIWQSRSRVPEARERLALRGITVSLFALAAWGRLQRDPWAHQHAPVLEGAGETGEHKITPAVDLEVD